MSARRLSVPILMVAIGAAFAATMLWRRQEVVEWIAGAGWGGVLVFAGIYVFGTLLLIPPGILNALSGAVFGTACGFGIVLPANIAAALIGFAISRTTGGAWARAEFQRRPYWGAIDRALGKRGFKIVFLLRCSPISPFAILNYAFGLTCVRFRDYAAATAVGTMPGTLLYVYAGSAAANASGLLTHSAHPGGMAGRLFFWVGLAATATAVTMIARYARGELRRATGKESHPT
jgi:uncharacterized membrane protein YdjX (TVP38/TMEM64 family)